MAGGFRLHTLAGRSGVSDIPDQVTDQFWLNLHHFLYVLGRAQAKTGDAKREAVADAPSENARGLEKLTADEQNGVE